MLKTVNICDRCGRQCEWDTIYAKTGRECDKAGDMDDKTEPVDLCSACMSRVVRDMVEKMTPEEAVEWAKMAKTPPPMRRV